MSESTGVSGFAWHYAESGTRRSTLQISSLLPVYFDTSVPRTRRWLHNKHKEGGMHEPPFTYTLLSLIRRIRPPVFFDIGANLGYFSLLAAASSANMAVYSFEMNPATYDRLLKNIRVNSHLDATRIHPVNVGIGERTELGKLVYYNRMNLSLDLHEDWQKTHLDILSLDHIHAEQNLTPTIIKIDVEGFEAMVLRGAKKLMMQAAPILLLELHSDGRLRTHGATRQSVVGDLLDLRYRIYALRENRAIQFDPQSLLIAVTTAKHPIIVDNQNSALVAVPEKQEEIIGAIRESW